MKISQKYSHLNGEEYLIVHHKELYSEIKKIINSIDAKNFKTKVSKEKTMKGSMLYSPVDLNKEFKNQFQQLNWAESRYSYYITLQRDLMEKSISMSAEKQKKFLI